jgi:2,4-dienoyl-CoA reductase-like NADH-dependent reductase (Old Yellow Enzyme family)
MFQLFDPVQIGPVTLPNRFIRSATTSYWSDDEGKIRPPIIELYRGLAKGGVGLIVKGHLYVQDSGKAHDGMAGISNDGHLPGLRALTCAVHDVGGRILAQLNHAGIKSVVDGAGPSAYTGDDWMARVLSTSEIDVIIEAFGDAADRAIRAGFDGVQIHGAHGYLVSQFLSRLTNQRIDHWGGSLDKRMRFLIAVYDELRTRLGSRVPILLKLNCDDFSPRGFTIEDSIQVAKAICHRGVDALEISGGGIGQRRDLRARARSTDEALAEASFAGYASRIRDQVQPTPVALVDGVRSRMCMDAVVSMGVADLVSMCRPFIMEPDLVQRLEAGQLAASCTSCDACRSRDVFGAMMLRCHLKTDQ